MALIDIIIGLPILYGIYQGYRKGLIIEIISFLAFFIAIYISLQMLAQGSQMLQNVLGDSFNNPLLSFIALFVPSMFLINKIGFAIKKSLRLTFIGTLDKLGGGLLGGVTWLFGISGIIWVLERIGIDLPSDWLVNERLYSYVKQFAPDMIAFVAQLIPKNQNWLESFKELLYNAKNQ